MDGLIVIDKPPGPTSHDVVARIRRVLRERRIGHTGTLDPAATGVLPLVIGRATRLARFLSASEKSYEAIIRLGVSTDTADATGRPIGSAFAGSLPTRDAIDRALDAFRGTFFQQPPAFSAKKVAGTRSHRIARRTEAPQARRRPVPAAVSVTTSAINVVSFDGNRLTLTVDCSAGFYVRSLAHDLGEALGTGAHLERLQRTRSGEFTLADAIELSVAEQHPDRAIAAVVPPSRMLPQAVAVVLTREGVRRAINGCDLGPRDAANASGFGISDSGFGLVRLLDPAGELVGIARPAATPGLLHPSVILM